VLERFQFFEGACLVALDGTGYFSSKNIHCASCQEKVDSKTGEIAYSHHMLAAALLHPDFKEVLPLAPEAIVKRDGDGKNDCERNAAKRLLRHIRREHPHMKLIVVEDGLASNAPHIRDLLELNFGFILGAKPGDHAFLFDRLGQAFDDEQVRILSWKEGDACCELAFVNGVPLNKSNQDLVLNVLQYLEVDADGEPIKRFTWVTDLKITRANAKLLMRGGRARWRIENETFNTLKNQGYHFEHNFGHGRENLSVVLAMLMMLAFLVNQIEQFCDPAFRAAWKRVGSKRALWDHVRSHYRHFLCTSMRQLSEAIAYDLAKNIPLPTLDTS
jgi:hypothetical protein